MYTLLRITTGTWQKNTRPDPSRMQDRKPTCSCNKQLTSASDSAEQPCRSPGSPEKKHIPTLAVCKTLESQQRFPMKPFSRTARLSPQKLSATCIQHTSKQNTGMTANPTDCYVMSKQHPDLTRQRQFMIAPTHSLTSRHGHASKVKVWLWALRRTY